MIRDYVERGILPVHSGYLGEHLLADSNTDARPFPDLERGSKIIYGHCAKSKLTISSRPTTRA